MKEINILKEKNTSISIEKEFRNLFNTYFCTLKGYAIFYVKDEQIAEDIVQNLFLNLWQKRSELTINISVKAYLIKCIHNACMQHIRNTANKTNLKVDFPFNEAKLFSAHKENHFCFFREFIYSSGYDSLHFKFV
jgi:DNA-directed RNA polymerase specialized sigma24 family protein